MDEKSYEEAWRGLQIRLQMAHKELLENTRADSPTWEAVLRARMAPDFTSYPSYPETMLDSDSLNTHVRNVGAFLDKNPDYRMEITSQTSSLQGPPDELIVVTHSTVLIRGLTIIEEAENQKIVDREAVSVFHWRCDRDGRWWVYKQGTMRGPGAMDEFPA